MTKNKYLISPNYLMQLENDDLRDRIKELKKENDEAKSRNSDNEAKIKELEAKLLDSTFSKGIDR